MKKKKRSASSAGEVDAAAGRARFKHKLHFPICFMGCLFSCNGYIMTICILCSPFYCIPGMSERGLAPAQQLALVPSPPPKRSSNSPSSLLVRGCADGPRQSQKQVCTPHSNPPERDRGRGPHVVRILSSRRTPSPTRARGGAITAWRHSPGARLCSAPVTSGVYATCAFCRHLLAAPPTQPLAHSLDRSIEIY